MSTSPQNLTPRVSAGRTVLACLVTAVIAWFYIWTYAPDYRLHATSKDVPGYYGSLAAGFLKGHLWMDRAADPALAAMKNPYDPGERGAHGLHDASYYRGHYYLYFGVTPVVLLFAPVLALGGSYVSEGFAAVLFCVVALVLGVITWRSVLRRNFPAASVWLELAGVVAVGVVTMVPTLLRRASIWEVPIACALACFMLALFALWKCLSRNNAPGWLALASFSVGLCIGARPVYIFATIMLLIPLAAQARQTGAGWWRRREARSLLLAAIVPVMIAGLWLALYNYLRFGSVVEFGQRYQMAGEDVTKLQLFSFSYLFYSLRIYLFSAPGLSSFFPFVTVITPPPAPAGQMGVEDPFGLLPSMPWVLLALGVLGRAWKRRDALGWWAAAAWIGTAATLCVVASFGGATNRYMVDFTPGFALLGAAGAACVLENARGVGRVLLGALVAVLLFWSTAFNVFASFQHNRLFAVSWPETYARVAHAFNRVPWLWDRLRGTKYGPVELRVVFPTDRAGKIQPLVVTGTQFLADYVYVHYLAADTVRFGFEHTGFGGSSGKAMKIRPGTEHVVTVQMGSLFPPEESPASDALGRKSAHLRALLVRVQLDGENALYYMAKTFDLSSREPLIGASGDNPGFKEDFSGKILAVKRVPPMPVSALAQQQGPLFLALQLPPFAGVRNEPLVCFGEPGKGDLLYLRYLDATHVSVGHDHWGVGATDSAPIEIKPDAVQEFLIACPALAGSGGRTVIKVNGQIVTDDIEAFYPAEAGTFVVGGNPIGASTASVGFTGQVLVAERRAK